MDWSGAYGGLLAGYDSISARTRLGPISTKLDADGVLGGIYTGRNFQFGSYVIGYDGAIQLTDVTGKGPEPTSPVASYRNNVQADVRARLGYAWGSFLPFIAGGATFGRSEQRDLLTGSQRGRVPLDGYTIGGGLDYRVSEHLSVRAEYLYEGTFTKARPALNGCACTQTRTGNEVRVGTAYHF